MPGAFWCGQEYFDYAGAHTWGTRVAYPDTPPAVSLQRDALEPPAKGLRIRPPREVEEEEEDSVDALLACVVASFCDPHVRGVALGEALEEPADACQR
jgi:hypothetical protein